MKDEVMDLISPSAHGAHRTARVTLADKETATYCTSFPLRSSAIVTERNAKRKQSLQRACSKTTKRGKKKPASGSCAYFGLGAMFHPR